MLIIRWLLVTFDFIFTPDRCLHAALYLISEIWCFLVETGMIFIRRIDGICQWIFWIRTFFIMEECINWKRLAVDLGSLADVQIFGDFFALHRNKNNKLSTIIN